MQDELLREHVRPVLGRDLDQPREDIRIAGDNAQLVFAVLAAEHDDRIDLPAAQEGEGLPPPDDARGDQRRDLGVKVTLELLALLPADLSEVDEAHALHLQLLHQAGIDLVLARVELAHGGQHRIELNVDPVMPVLFSRMSGSTFCWSISEPTRTMKNSSRLLW